MAVYVIKSSSVSASASHGDEYAMIGYSYGSDVITITINGCTCMFPAQMNSSGGPDRNRHASTIHAIREAAENLPVIT